LLHRVSGGGGGWRRSLVDITKRINTARCALLQRVKRYREEDRAFLEKRRTVYQAAKARNPYRWSGGTRNWQAIGSVVLNPEKEVPLSP
jgi:thymidylate kinase